MGLISNMVVISPEVLKFMQDKYLDIIVKDSNEIILPATKRSYLRLKENIYSLFANLLRSETVRAYFLNPNEDVRRLLALLLTNLNTVAIMNHSNLTWIKSVESIEAIFINLAFNTSEEIRRRVLVEELHLFEFFRRFANLDFKDSHYTMIVYRAVQLLSKLEFMENYVTDKDFNKRIFTVYLNSDARKAGIANHTIRLLIKWFDLKNDKLIKKQLKADELVPITQNIKEILKDQDEERFVNTTILAGELVEMYPELQSKFRDIINYLLNLVKDKVGLVRKNAGIFVAKLSKDPGNLEEIRNLHGIEVLSSVSKFILEK